MNDIRALQNAESPLLRLPLELKTRIYELVCGGQTLHISRGDGRLSHHLCRAKLSEEEIQEKFDTSEAVWYAPETAYCHWHCYAHTESAHGCHICTHHTNSWRPPTAKLDLNVLHCCRQIYLESMFVPYHANTFSFDSAILLSQFYRHIPERYRIVIRSLHVNLLIFMREKYYIQDWNMAFENVRTSLKGLQRLYITMELYPLDAEPRYEDHRPIEKSLLSHISQAGKLDLKVATVVLWDSHSTFRWSNDEIGMGGLQERRTLAQMQEWSRCLRKALLQRLRFGLGELEA